MHRLAFFLALALAAPAFSQQSSSSSSGTSVQQPAAPSHLAARQAEAAGAPITLEISEPLFQVATALNACGYDSDLSTSNPVRAEVRADVAEVVSAKPAAAKARATLCAYVDEHQLTDRARQVAQYVSLSLYLGPAPALVPTADETDMPPDALAVVNILPLLRTFAATVNLHAIWLRHHAQFDAIVNTVHDPITAMILNTNVYLKVPTSSYDGRRLLILIEPMLAPNAPNGRIYSSDYVIVTSPTPTDVVKMDQIRHLYLQYEIEPLVYARAQSMVRLVPLLKPEQAAPVDYIYKSDVIALVTECLIRAIEARTLDTGIAAPTRPPTGTRDRAILARYDEELGSVNRQAEVQRRKLVDLDMRQGWVLTEYFYTELQTSERSPDSLSSLMGPMVYGMDVSREVHRAQAVKFLPEGSGEFIRRVPRPPTGMALAEKKMLERDYDGAEEIADKALGNPATTPNDHADALYIRARVELLRGDPETSTADFQTILQQSQDPRTLAWAHIYLGRLYDTKDPAERKEAVTEYRAALAVPGVQPDARSAAEHGLKVPFNVPRTEHREEEPLDPSGKAEKDSYKPE